MSFEIYPSKALNEYAQTDVQEFEESPDITEQLQ
jgi:hypothetical protein